ncbi:MAG: hypothetical protein M3Z05_18885, partial [Gemmatimonadota bacterium]|nr:hypothetical protein [Gemmatimonadota bacterium]
MLRAFPTPAEIEAVENYTFEAAERTLEDVIAAAGGPIAIIVFATEYRAAADTVHGAHADMCFSRMGIARVGTASALYDGMRRGYLPFDASQESAVRVIPARYAAYLAVRRTPSSMVDFGPMDRRPGDDMLQFWIPVHKLFPGAGCLRGLDLDVTYRSHAQNDKLRRVHESLRDAQGNSQGDNEYSVADLAAPPFTITSDLAELSKQRDDGNGLLIPKPRDRVLQRATLRGRPVTFRVPNNSLAPTFDGSVAIRLSGKKAPTFVYARRAIDDAGIEHDLNDRADMREVVARGGYRAVEFTDGTGDGWVDVDIPALASNIARHAAYSVIGAPNYYPHISVRELARWVGRTFAPNDQPVWGMQPPMPLTDTRLPGNAELDSTRFDPMDWTVTSIVSMARPGLTRREWPRIHDQRQGCLPDSASGVQNPGWDISSGVLDLSGKTVMFLTPDALASPFLEDAKICAAMSSYWPAQVPDMARSYERPHGTANSGLDPSPSVCPLTDEELDTNGRAWD